MNPPAVVQLEHHCPVVICHQREGFTTGGGRHKRYLSLRISLLVRRLQVPASQQQDSCACDHFSMLLAPMSEKSAHTNGARGEEDAVGAIEGDRRGMGRRGRAHKRGHLARPLCRRRIIILTILLCWRLLLQKSSPLTHAPAVLIGTVHLLDTACNISEPDRQNTKAFTRLLFFATHLLAGSSFLMCQKFVSSFVRKVALARGTHAENETSCAKHIPQGGWTASAAQQPAVLGPPPVPCAAAHSPPRMPCSHRLPPLPPEHMPQNASGSERLGMPSCRP